MSKFADYFNMQPIIEASAPGRVNLLGEHTDYNDGFVLPIAIHQRTCVQMSLSNDQWNRFFSINLNQMIHYRAGDPIPKGFGAYLGGCINILREKNCSIKAVNVLINSNIPIEAGLSSSAALEVAMLKGLRTLFDLKLNDIDLALCAQQAEVRFAGIQCGIMDQMAATLATEHNMLFLDTRTLDYKLLPLPKQTELIVMHSGVPRRLSDSAYNQRRIECKTAAQKLGVAALRDINDVASVAMLPPPLNRRARHVITENARVLKAAAVELDPREFGELMNASHQSLREDFEVSIPALDCLVSLLQSHPAVYGARLTGAGFGGACVALARKGLGLDIASDVLTKFQAQGYQGYIMT